ncbi:hypothetical protein SSS_06185, partial [Sarcoptes scabiei]
GIFFRFSPHFKEYSKNVFVFLKLKFCFSIKKNNVFVATIHDPLLTRSLFCLDSFQKPSLPENYVCQIYESENFPYPLDSSHEIRINKEFQESNHIIDPKALTHFKRFQQ